MTASGALTSRLRAKVGSPTADGCWPWTASLRGGYGQVRDGARVRAAHVVVYELLVGPVPPGLVLDHLCRRADCVNPVHLDPVEQYENVRRGAGRTSLNLAKQLCERGHLLPPHEPRTKRQCRPCRLLTARERRQRRSA